MPSRNDAVGGPSSDPSKVETARKTTPTNHLVAYELTRLLDTG